MSLIFPLLGRPFLLFFTKYELDSLVINFTTQWFLSNFLKHIHCAAQDRIPIDFCITYY